MSDPNSPLSRFQLWRAALPPALRLLLTINLLLFALVAVFGILAAFGFGLPLRLLEFLALPGDPSDVLFRPWAPLTYGFVNLYLGDPFWWIIGFAFARYWLNWLGRDFEESYGGYRLFGLYLGSAVFGAVVALALNAIVVTPLARPFYEGAWVPVTAVLVCVATLHPNRGVGLFLLGVIPMKWIALAFVVLSLFRPNAALLGAALFGFLFAKAQQRDLDLAAWARPLFDRRPKRTKPASSSAPRRGGRFSTPESSSSSRTVGKAVATRAATSRKRSDASPPTVDSVLDKILDKGYDSLTAEERRILDEASRDG